MGDAQQNQAEVDARHAQLVQRDHVVGVEAEIGRQNAEILRLNADNRRLKGRASRLSDRKVAQAERVTDLQTKLQAARKRNADLAKRVAQLEAQLAARPPSVTRRVMRRLRGSGR